ncbi:helix-turn-helix transcriptional regulator [Streptomyces sp. ME02-8801-2C]|uniref:helix-turn-helix domain-containing protein n=1 Tax=Streptomyces sp. ME02-8801-2C TaxID=3028680 RepID=UPI0029A8C297|nr:helix-turn-helix transcriptional regulator [Streptomyces sp. ME02-8801-2C]MDX3457797.1 helix-turn-helix transcriptional regulator [Streptomyces sp. ME02-8801-2C]
MAVETDPAPDPTKSLLAFFGTELARIRIKLGLSQEQTARLAHTTQSMISKVEAAKRVPSLDLARDLDLALKTDGHFARLHPLVIRYAYPSWFLPFVELEGDATSIQSFQNQVFHGLLQTEAYARAMLLTVRPDNLDDLVAARMTRQEIFEREERPRTWFIVDEYVLMRHIGGESVMRAQFEHLLATGQHPRTVIQIIPRTVVAHPGLAGPFTVLGFEEGPDVLHVDGFSQGRTALGQDEVAEGIRAYDLLRAVALSPDASAELIRRHLKELDT